MVGRMTPDRHVDRLMDKLLRAIELSLRATEARVTPCRRS